MKDNEQASEPTGDTVALSQGWYVTGLDSTSTVTVVDEFPTKKADYTVLTIGLLIVFLFGFAIGRVVAPFHTIYKNKLIIKGKPMRPFYKQKPPIQP